MNALSVMQQLAATNSRIEKEQILIDAFMKGNDDFFTGAKWALDSLVTFGQKKIAEIVEVADDEPTEPVPFSEFLVLAQNLRERKLTGHAARDAIHEMAGRCDPNTWNLFYRRILLKDLGVGVDESTINKVLKKLSASNPKANDYIIPVFKCQLAHDGEDDAHKKKVKGIKLVDYKLDGCRVLAVLDPPNDSVSLFSRNGQSFTDQFPETVMELQVLLKRLPGPVVLDGELMSPQGFQHLMTLTKRKEPHPDTALIRYALFDIIPMKDFFDGKCATSQRKRREALEAMQTSGMFSSNRNGLYVVPQIEVDLDTDDGRAALNEFNKQALSSGLEGVMVKDPQAPYEGKRTVAWLKIKPVISVTLEIVGFDPGKPDGKYAKTLGALVCAGTDSGYKIETNVSGGLSDELRDEIWNNQESYLGMMVEITADKMTLEDGQTVWSLRFPRLKCFRGRVPGEKL